MLNWSEMRRDVFAILLLCLDGYTVPDAVAEADNLIRMLDTGELGKIEP